MRARLSHLARSPDARAVTALLAVVALFFLPAIVGSGQFLGLDSGAMHHPMKEWIAGELRAGHLPQWNPRLGLGVPVVAGAIDGIFHPFTLLLVSPLPFEAAFKAWVILSYALAAVGSFAWARRLGAAPPAAAAAGLAWALSGYLVSSSANLTFLTALASLPLLLAAAHGFVERPGPGRLALVAAAGFLAAAGGDPQSFVLVAAALPAVAATTVSSPASPWRRAALGALAAGVGLAAASPVLVPLAAWVPHSSRGEPLDPVDVGRFNLHPVRLLELAVPFLLRGAPGAATPLPYRAFFADPYTVRPWVDSVHLGAAALALAVLAAVRGRGARALLAAAVLAAWMALGPHAGFGSVAQALPLLSRFRFWEKLAALIPLVVAAGAALGVEALGREARPRRFAAATGAAGGAFVVAGLLLLATGGALAASMGGAERLEAARMLVANLRAGLLVSGSALLALAAAAWFRPRWALLTAAIVGAELFVSSSGAWSLSPLEVARPELPLAEYLLRQPGLQRIVTGGPTVLPSRSRREGLTEYEANARWYVRRLDSAANVSRGIGNLTNYVALVPARAMRFERRRYGRPITTGAGLLGIGHAVISAEPGVAEAMRLDPTLPVAAVDEEAALQLLSLPHRPRAYLASWLREVDRRGAMEFLLSADPLAPQSAIEGPVPPGYAPPSGSASIVEDRPERVVVVTQSDRPALLVLNDVYAAGWTAAVDGRPAEIVPVNYLARGVWVPPGRREVAFTFRTAGLAEGWGILLATALGIGAWAAARRRSDGAAVA